MNADQFGKALKRDAGRLGRGEPAGMEQRILRAVAAEPLPDRPESRSINPWIPIGVAAAAGLAVLLAILGPGRGAPQHALSAPVVPPPGTAVAAVARATENAAPAETVLSSPVELLREDPLQDEANSVYSDAQSAVRFLALNFLPSSPRKNAGS